MSSLERAAIVGPVDCRTLARSLGHSAPDTLPPGRDGPASAITAMITALARRLDLHVVTTDFSVSAPLRIGIGRVALTVVPARRNRAVRDLHRVERHGLAHALDREPVDVINAHWTYEYALAALRARQSVPVLVCVRDWAPRLLKINPRQPYNYLRLAMQRNVLRRADAFAAPSPYVQRLLHRSGRSASLLPNAVDETTFSWADPEPPRRARLLAVDIGFGRLKNVRTLLAAFRLVRRESSEASLALVGRGYETGGVAQRWAEDYGLDEGVEFVGPLPNAEVRKLMRRTTLLVHPSLEETFGNVLIEAMAVGTPVLGGCRSGAVPWVLDNGRGGYLADVESAEGLAGAIVGALSDPDEMREMGRRGREHTWRRFRSGYVAERYLEEFSNVRT